MSTSYDKLYIKTEKHKIIKYPYLLVVLQKSILPCDNVLCDSDVSWPPCEVTLAHSVGVYDICGNNLSFGGFVKTTPPDEVVYGFMYFDSVCSIMTFDV